MKSVLPSKSKLIIIELIVGCCFISSCAGKLEKASNIALHAGLKPKVIQTKNFKIQGFYRISRLEAPISIYIEGDGMAWVNRYKPSSNPTPRNPLALRLAAIDNSENVLYLARPCQYVDLSTEKLCNVSYWTHKRFAKEIILAIDEAINIIASRSKATSIHLIGYSGGGAIVAMVAARRDDIASIRTVAGYMDHVALNRKANVSPLIGSLDPIRAAPRLKKIPQIHYSGKNDKRIPGWILKNFRKAVGDSKCVTLRQVNASHEEGWEEIWGKIWSKVPTCKQ
jgi:hypothetical protein